ncbi:hypothetical protein [Shewanella phaeophyticola]|uniref:Thioesterase domain-containing protein n=1 Tax=Shewanella phaeophyticola TaxID=2978345 RepID=A0ABT2P1U8_9GAMM|nr:hypothetical protein [Shewanella sp. KJ10-1]MCT8986376.1 hypothetical protein [Shewanella sp. KJ10-1]
MMKNLTGLQQMQAILNGEIPAPSINEVIPMNPIDVNEGNVMFEAFANEHHLNPMGGVHGGFAATVQGSVDLSRLFLQRIVGHFYKAETLKCSYST